MTPMHYAILMIAGSLLISYGYVYADTVKFPTLTDDGLVDYQLDTFYPSNSTYIVQISLLYEVEHSIEIPPKVTWFDVDGTAHFISLQDEFNLIYNPAEDEVTPVITPSLTDREIDQILDEKKEELAEGQSQGYTKLRLCLEEFKAERPIAFQAWERMANLQEFTLSDQQLYADHPTVAETNANKKHQECEIRKAYTYVGIWEANKIIDPLTNTGADMSDAEETDPVTAEDIRQEEIKAEAFACSKSGTQQGLCKDYLAGEEYLIPKPRMPAWYGTYNDMKQETPDVQGAIDKAMLEMCFQYYPLYEATDAIKIPTWLEHCVP